MSSQLQERAGLIRAQELQADDGSEILAKVSHELRTPLTAAQESVSIVLEELAGPVNARQLEFLTVAQRNIQRLKRLIEDLLDLSPNPPEPELILVPADLRDIAAAAVASRQCLGENPQVTGLTEGSAVYVAADFERMRQVICRLLDNAAYYAVKDPVTLAIYRDCEYARLEVCDDGPGIPVADVERIFDPFVQLGSSQARGAGRTGLGLTLARHLVERQGGALWAESKEGGGTRFVISIKLLPT